MIKKLLLIGILLAGIHDYVGAQNLTPEHSGTFAKRESITGIGTAHTVYTTPLTMDVRCQDKVKGYLALQNGIQSFSVAEHTVDIMWENPTSENVVLFHSKLEYQAIFPCAK